MINKIYKRIHNKYLKLFNFFFFLRYIFLIFLIAISLFLSIPKFFNYEKKQEVISEYLINNYGLELLNFNTIKFKVFPFPNLFIENANIKIKKYSINLKSNNVIIFLNIKNLYNYKNFKVNRIILNDNELTINVNRSKDIINYIKNLKNKLDIIALNINLKKKKNTLIKIKDINLSNYGYQKYHITGKIFDKKFISILKEDNHSLNFKLLNTGVKAKFLFTKNFQNSIEGTSKINLLNNLLKFNFSFDNNELKLIKSNFRNKNISFSLDSLIKFNPFFNINSNIIINEVDKNLLNKIKLENILKNKEIIKKLNSQIKINYKNKSFFSNLIESYSSELNLAYGRLVFSSKIIVNGGKLDCIGDLKLIDEYPRMNFVCLFNLLNKKKLFRKFSISKKTNNKQEQINIEGSLNLINKKVNFKKINNNGSYQANEEDMKYYKMAFETILFDESFFKIFNKNKIKLFLLEII